MDLVIWTTTPWTLPGNMAVALHPQYQYALVDTGERRLVLAADLADACLRRYGIEHYEVLGHAEGSRLEHQALQHPLYDRQVPVILGEHVTLEAGTGAVHTAPGHGQEDFAVGQVYGLEVYNPVGPDGRFVADTPGSRSPRPTRR